MRTRLIQLGVALALIGAIGAHWALLQTVAWTGMLLSYSREATLAEAVVRTFNGRSPCKLCLEVRDGKKAERQSEFHKLETKTDYWLLSASLLLFPPQVVSLSSFPGLPALLRFARIDHCL